MAYHGCIDFRNPHLSAISAGGYGKGLPTMSFGNSRAWHLEGLPEVMIARLAQQQDVYIRGMRQRYETARTWRVTRFRCTRLPCAC